MVTGLSHDVTDEDMHAVFTPICGAVHVQLLPPRDSVASPTALVRPVRSHAHAYDNAIIKGLNANGIVVRGRRIGVCGTFSGQGRYSDAAHNPGSPGYPHTHMRRKGGLRKPRHRWGHQYGHEHLNTPHVPNHMGRHGPGHPHLVPGYGGQAVPSAMPISLDCSNFRWPHAGTTDEAPKKRAKRQIHAVAVEWAFSNGSKAFERTSL